MESSTRCLDVGNNLSCSDEGVIHLGPLEISDPRIFYHAEDKFISLALRGFKGHVVAALGLVYRPLSGVDRCLFIVLDRHVVNNGIAWSGERGGVVHCVGCRALYDPDEVMNPILLVLRGEKEGF